MDSLLENVNTLIKMRVGEPYRLEHIKFRLKQNKTLRNSDRKYLKSLLDRYIQNAEEDGQQQKIKQKNKNQEIKQRELQQEPKQESANSSEEDSDSIYCWNCGTKNKRSLKFCINCDWEIHTVKATKEDNVDKVISKKKIRKEIVIIGLALMIFGSAAFIVPLGESGLTINEQNVLCKSDLEINGQIFSEEQSKENCSLISQIMILASFFGTLGIILIIIGLVMKKTIIKK